MKTAEEIMDEYGIEMQNFIASSHWLAVKFAINEARKEAIEECAGKAGTYSYDMGRTEILALINELK